MPRSTIGILFALLAVPALATQVASGQRPGAALEGEWGGDRLQLVFDAQGGRVELECASGRIVGPVALSGAGKFVAMGTFEQHQGGPQRADESAAPANARYSGEVTNGVMKLTILPAGARAAQVFNLRKGVRVKLIRCL